MWQVGKRYKAQAVEVGKYRQAASRVQSHAEAIVSADGTQREAEILAEKFGNTLQVQKDLKWTISKFELIFKVAYSYGCRSWMAAFTMAPLLNSATGTVGKVTTIINSLNYIMEALVANGKILTFHAQAQQMRLLIRLSL